MAAFTLGDLLNPLVLFGFAGQFVFMLRFVVQWLASERRGRSVIPLAFWYLSLAGGVMLLVYAVLRQDPVFVLGQGLGLFIYARNLALIHRRRSLLRDRSLRTPAVSAGSEPPPAVEPVR
ncbi:MAG: lipid-A-disaccharide synthase N-terminal domain-containing protein [Phycisphaerae bacterium]